MECVSAIAPTSCLAAPPTGTPEYAVDGLMQNSWAINSSHIALFDYISQWTFRKGTAVSHSHQLYQDSPPISPRSRPTHLGNAIPQFSLEGEVDDSVISTSLLDTTNSPEQNKLLELSKGKGSELEGPKSSQPNPNVGGIGKQKGAQFLLVSLLLTGILPHEPNSRLILDYLGK
jgi:hypothetical protein